jgi:protein-disulfide isomerase
MNETMERVTSSRGAAVLGMLVTFLGGYVLGSMSRSESAAALADPARAGRKVVPVGLSPALGPSDALVTIVEFSDFQCPFCARSLPLQKRVLAEYPGKVRWVFKHMPLRFHSNARPAAEAAMAAHAQGRFWEYHDRLFQNQGRLTEPDLAAHAEALGLDQERFKRELQGKAYDKTVQADVDLANQLKVQGTPNFFINGRHFTGSMSFARLESVVREEISYTRQLLREGVQREQLYHELTKGKAADEQKKVEPAQGPADEERKPEPAKGSGDEQRKAEPASAAQ